MDKWSPLVVEDIIEDLGYEMAGRVKVYWLRPGKAVNEDGLVLIKKDADTNSMVSMVEFGHRFLDMYLDHDDNLNGYNRDNAVAYPAAQSPLTVSPSKLSYVQRQQDEKFHLLDTEMQSSSRTTNHDDNESDIDSEDSDFIPEIVDSDYILDDEDDDLFDDYVDNLDNLKGKQVAEPTEDSEEDEIQLPDSDEEEVRFNFKKFREEDMHNPNFYVGQLFSSIDMLRKAINEYSCKNRVDIRKPTNERTRLGAKCAEEGCPWYLWVSKDSRTKSLMVKRYTEEHTCRKKWKIRAFTSKFLADKYIESFRADENMNLKNFSRIVQKEWNMTPSRSKLCRARRLAMKAIYGDEVAQYNLLWDYANEIRRSNPGSSFYLSLDKNGRFNHCCFSFDACKRGFLAACRPVICLDGCHIKTKYGGQLLTAVGMDPNDCIFSIAFAVVEVEDTLTWSWFLTTLKQDLGIVNTGPWTIMSDKQMGLIRAVSDHFPHSEHRFCVRHMWQNFNVLFKGDVLKNQLWKIARSNTLVSWEAAMEEMKEINADAYKWLEELPPNTWVRAFQSDLPKCDILLNNNCEVFNKYILEARELSILTMVDRIKTQLMTRIYNKQKEVEKWSGLICPKIMKKLAKNTELANACFVSPAGEGIFEVAGKGTQYIVDLKVRSRTCRRWDLSGIPCSHAIACMREDRIAQEDMVHSCYSIESFCKAYGNIIVPCHDKKEWQKMNGCPIEPPLYVKKVGRPPKNRRKQPHEADSKKGGKKMSRHGVAIHCTHCRKSGHNKAGCSDAKAGLPPMEEATKIIRPLPNTSEEDDPVITQDHNIQWRDGDLQSSQQYRAIMLDDMLHERTQIQRGPAHPTPLPDSGFIQSAVMNQCSIAPTTAVRQGSQAKKLENMKHAKNIAIAAKREAALEAKLKAAEDKATEARARKAHAAEKKAALAQARKVEAAQKRAAIFEAKKIAAEEKKALAVAKKEQAAAKRAADAHARQQAQAAKKAKKN